MGGHLAPARPRAEEPHLEHRLHNHGRSAETEGGSGGEWIGLPVRLLPNLLQALTQAQDQLRAWGLLKCSQSATNAGSLTRRMDARQLPRVVMGPAAECRIVDPEAPEVAQAIIGQIKDVSRGGAQAWFPQRFPPLKQVDVFMTIEGVSFGGGGRRSLDPTSEGRPRSKAASAGAFFGGSRCTLRAWPPSPVLRRAPERRGRCPAAESAFEGATMMEGPRVRPKLRRIKGKGWLGGVCAGFGYWLGIPTWLVRLIWTVLVLVYGVGAVLYILLWIFMPAWDAVPEGYEERAGG